MDLIEEAPAVDGRRARRERGRMAVIDAVFELMREGRTSPNVEAIAERAGVSVSSVFRYFENIEDLQQQTIERYFERFSPLFAIPAIGDGDRDGRIGRLVDARLGLYETIGPIGRLARVRAADTERFAQTLERTRALMAGQIRIHFAVEVEGRTPARGDDLVALIDSLTSFEAWDLLRTSHGRSRQQVRRAWVTGVAAVCR